MYTNRYYQYTVGRSCEVDIAVLPGVGGRRGYRWGLVQETVQCRTTVYMYPTTYVVLIPLRLTIPRPSHGEDWDKST